MLISGLQASMAQGLSSSDMNFAFGGNTATGTQEVHRSTPAPQMLRPEEMAQIEGEAPPIIAGAIVAGKWVASRVVSQRAATSVVRKGGDVMVGTRQQATQIARAASNGQARPIREFHPGSGQRFSHVHPNPRTGGHVFYGRPR